VVLAVVAGTALARRNGRGDVITDPTPPPVPTTQRPPGTTEAPTAPTTATITTVAPPPATATGPIVAREGILGVWDGTAWVAWRLGDAPPSTRDYQVARLGAPVRTVAGSSAAGCTPGGEPRVEVGLGWDAGQRGIAVARSGDLQPRPVEILDAAGGQYQEAAAGVAAGLGIADQAPVVRQVVRADLDGDGSAEVFAVAGRGATEPGQAAVGDWSVVFERRVVGGAVETTVLDHNVWDGSAPDYPPAIEQYAILAVADVNGDGTLEVALSTQYWESSSTGLLEVGDDGTLGEVLSASCGA
jgi:hypothetical protein